MSDPKQQIEGVILAGGASRRFGGRTKALQRLNGRPLIDHVVAGLRPQVSRLSISTDDPAIAAHCVAHPLLPDPVPDRPGPLAGILAALTDAQKRRPTPAVAVLSTPCDCPFLPHDLAERLWAGGAVQTGRVAVPVFAGRVHYSTALWPISAAETIAAALSAGERRVGAVIDRLGSVTVDWDDREKDPFTNINTPDDLAQAETRTKKEGG